MKQLRTFSITAIFTILSFTIVGILSCTKPIIVKNGTIIDPCKDVACFNGGTCLDGNCVCPAGFDGKNCQDTWISRYLGNYEANDQCDLANKYNVSLTNNAKPNELTINGISNFCSGVNITGSITNKTTLDFPTQRFCNDVYISGTASQTENGNFINVWLTARDSATHTSTSCSINLRKL